MEESELPEIPKVTLTRDTPVSQVRVCLEHLLSPVDRDRRSVMVVATDMISFGVDLALVDELHIVHSTVLRRIPGRLCDPANEEEESARDRLRCASWNLQCADTAKSRREAAAEFLAALAELIICLLRFLIRVLLTLLSRLLGYDTVGAVPVWQPEPIDAAPQITPRGPNPVFPVNTHRGGHGSSSAHGSVAPAA